MKLTGLLKILFLSMQILSLIALFFFENEIICWVNMATFIILSILSLIQIVIFNNNYNSEFNFWLLKYFIAVTLLIQSVCFIALLLGFQQIGEWKYCLIVSGSFFIIDFIFIFVFIKQFLVPEFKKLFLINILAPALVIIFLGIIPLAMRERDLYTNFNRESYHQTYDQYIQKEANNNSDQIPSF